MATLVEGPLARSPLDHALGEAEERTLAELEPIRQSLRRAVQAVLTQDTTIADEVKAHASDFDRHYHDVHDKLLAVIARQTPVAGDLRLAIALLHVNDRAERMAAQCLNIATMCCAQPEGTRPSKDQLECLESMARIADEQVGRAIRVFAERDVEGVDAVREHDAAINEHNRNCFTQAIETSDVRERRASAVFLALMARAIERIGDNAVDIARQTDFVVNGRMRNTLAR